MVLDVNIANALLSGLISRSNSVIYDSPLRIAIIGGGIAGTMIGLGLCEANSLFLQMETDEMELPPFAISLFESGGSLVNGPPFCHLHAGGNLYREISDDQCMLLLEQCIDVCRLFPHCIERRPQ